LLWSNTYAVGVNQAGDLIVLEINAHADAPPGNNQTRPATPPVRPGHEAENVIAQQLLECQQVAAAMDQENSRRTGAPF
jgi:hypothetical protein